MTILELLSLVFSIGCLFYLIQGIGKRIVIQETIMAYACINYLVMPIVAYHIFNENSRLALLWETVMPITSNQYFSIVLPSLAGIALGLFWPLRNKKISDEILLENSKSYLARRRVIGFILIVLGFLFSMFYGIVPNSIAAVFYMGGQLLFVGLFYLLFSESKHKWLVLSVGISILLVQAIRTAMYGELLFWSYFALIYLVVGNKRYSFVPKIGLMVFGIISILLIQSIKHEYRDKKTSSDAKAFFLLIQKRILSPADIFNQNKIYGAVTRGNQGFLMARTIDYVPRHEPYAKGETIVKSVAASIVPRIFWKNKPVLGGVENTCRFLGDCWRRDYSYNIGQVGEGYANFGPRWNILYMFLYGIFINWSLGLIKKFSLRLPSLIMWVPLLYFAALSMETDLLTFLNTLVKGVIFMLLIYGGFRIIMRWNI